MSHSENLHAADLVSKLQLFLFLPILQRSHSHSSSPAAMVRLVGLTGPIACGKSTVSALLAEGGRGFLFLLASKSWCRCPESDVLPPAAVVESGQAGLSSMPTRLHMNSSLTLQVPRISRMCTCLSERESVCVCLCVNGSRSWT